MVVFWPIYYFSVFFSYFRAKLEWGDFVIFSYFFVFPDLRVFVFCSTPGRSQSFLRHCNTMEGPNLPSYLRGVLNQLTTLSISAVMFPWENLQHLQRYSEKFQFEATCVRLWANGIQEQIMDEQEKVQNWSLGMTDESIDCAESSQRGLNICNLKGTNNLLCRWPQLPAHSRHKHHPVQFLWSQ